MRLFSNNSNKSMDIKEVIYQYFPRSVDISFEQYKKGSINLTYHLIIKEDEEKRDYILQKMNGIFDVSIMEDILFITNNLISKNIITQKIIKTLDGKLFVMDGSSWWRILTYIPGKNYSAVFSLKQAREAGRLVGVFHNALAGCNYEFKFKLPHYHDIDFTIKKLKLTLVENKETDKYKQLKNLAESILNEHKNISQGLSLPKRVIHNDLKITNILFDDNHNAIALIDLDTLTRGTIAVELGDALRSWCMLGGEDSKEPHFDLNIYKEALNGYYSSAKFLTESEKKSIPYGVKLITLELSARFLIDAFNENYFNLDSSQYKNLFEQNKKRAENQFEFFKEFLTSFNAGLL